MDYKCESCSKSFSEEPPFIQFHEGHKDYKCESCENSFSHRGHLKQHIHTIHGGHKDYNCESCSKSFTRAGSLKKHIHTVHNGQGPGNRGVWGGRTPSRIRDLCSKIFFLKFSYLFGPPLDKNRSQAPEYQVYSFRKCNHTI